MSFLNINNSEVTHRIEPLRTARSFIHRVINTTYLEESLAKNTALKTLEGVLEKEAMFLIQDFYFAREQDEDLLKKPLLKIKVRTTNSCILDLHEIEAKIGGLVATHGSIFDISRSHQNIMAGRKILDENTLGEGLEKRNIKSFFDEESEDIVSYVTLDLLQIQNYIESKKMRSPLIQELNKNCRKYVNNETYFKSLINKYDKAFKEEFQDTIYKLESSRQKEFYDQAGRVVKNLDTLFSVPGELSNLVRKLDGRIDLAETYPLLAKKHLDSHRFNAGQLSQYFEHRESSMQNQLDELLQEAQQVGILPNQDNLGKRDFPTHLENTTAENTEETIQKNQGKSFKEASSGKLENELENLVAELQAETGIDFKS